MAHTYKLTYFDFPGKGEAIRMILSYGEIPFEDKRIQMGDWPKIKPTTPLGQVPVLHINDKSITQTGPICRYLANIVGLAGNNNEENLEIDVAAEMIGDVLKTAYEYRFETDETRKEKVKERLLELMPIIFTVLEENAIRNQGYIALDRVTFADIIFLCAYEDIRNILENTDVIADYPNLQEVKKNLLSIESLKDWIQKRPTLPIFIYDLKNDIASE
ncbi:glutathione S-transferase-like isoform X3 [Diabrotica virgifera virgifera]|uniref:glutathione transferase n=1 Tax=Diabrotica virgifera virgifera TaxID=50390 RepID=A0ABM5KI64_DIAVI|nr:glutathione S-transferase-like isoform X3 [Diabrotica virgifera virgifera]